MWKGIPKKLKKKPRKIHVKKFMFMFIFQKILHKLDVIFPHIFGIQEQLFSTLFSE